MDGEAGSSERYSSDHFVLSCWWQSNLSRLGVVVVMTSLLIKCQIYARCCRQNSLVPWHSSPTALRPPLSHLHRWSAPDQPVLTGLWGHPEARVCPGRPWASQSQHLLLRMGLQKSQLAQQSCHSRGRLSAAHTSRVLLSRACPMIIPGHGTLLGASSPHR